MKSGATQGAIIAVLIGLSIDIFMYTTTTLYPDWTVAGMDALINIITGAIGGAVIGWWLGRGAGGARGVASASA